MTTTPMTTTAADATSVDPDLALMLLADGRLPTGSHAQSAGLEPALHAGMPSAAIPAYLASRLGSVTLVEAGTAVVARHFLASGWDLGPVEAAWAARTPSPAVRASSRTVGRGYLRLLRRLWPTHDVTVRLAATRSHAAWMPAGPAAKPTGAASGTSGAAASVSSGAAEAGATSGAAASGTTGASAAAATRAPRRAAVVAPSRPVALAGLAVVLGLSPGRLARLVCYDEIQSVTAAALKLVPMEPADTVIWALAMAGPVEQVVTSVGELTDPSGIPAVAAPLMDQWAQAHADSTRRLFHG